MRILRKFEEKPRATLKLNNCTRTNARAQTPYLYQAINLDYEVVFIRATTSVVEVLGRPRGRRRN
jgi:hypothetical protein